MHFVTNPHYWSTILKFKETLSFDPVVDGITETAFSIPRSGMAKPYQQRHARSCSTFKAAMDRRSHNAIHCAHLVQLRDMPRSFAESDLFSFVLNLLVPATAATLFGTEQITNAPLLVQQFVTYDQKFPLLAGGFPQRFLSKAVASFRALASTSLSVLLVLASCLFSVRNPKCAVWSPVTVSDLRLVSMFVSVCPSNAVSLVRLSHRVTPAGHGPYACGGGHCRTQSLLRGSYVCLSVCLLVF